LTANFTTDAASLLLDARGVIEPAKDRGAVPAGRAPAENSFANLVMSRRSIRRYRPEPVDEALVERILAHATWAPSAHNRQPWRFAAVAQTKRRTLADAMAARLRRDRLADKEALLAPAIKPNVDDERQCTQQIGAQDITRPMLSQVNT